MGIFDGMLLASDFDGTLANDSGEITKEVRQAIAWFIAQGGRFTVSTGRTYQGFHLYDERFINAPVLLANGAMAFDYAAGDIVFCDGIGEEGIAAVMAIRSRFPAVAVEMYPFNDTYAINLTPDSARHFSSQGIPFRVVSDAADAPLPWVKAMLGAGEASGAVQVFLREAAFPGIHFLPTTGSYVELLHTGVDKGTGLLKLADMLGISRSCVFAIGDGYNDVEMLTAAAAAFVPENGDAEARSAASHIVRSNNKGAVAHAIALLRSYRPGADKPFR